MIRLKPLQDQVVVVMGASSGIGRAAAVRLAGRGARVVVASRNIAALNELTTEIIEGGGIAVAQSCDVADFEQVKAVAQRAVDEFGHLDSWVHSSGIVQYSRFEDTPLEDFEHILQVNTLGQIRGAKAALPHLRKEGRGALIHVSSIEGYRAIPYHSAYGMSKHAVNGFLQALRIELRQEGLPIAVTNVMPAATNTPLFGVARNRLGVAAKGPPLAYQPETVAALIEHACEHACRDLYGGGVAKAFVLAERLAPSILDSGFTRFGFRIHRTNEPSTGHDNFHEPSPHSTKERGQLRAFERSAYNWWQMRSPIRRISRRFSGPPRFRDKSEPNLEG